MKDFSILENKLNLSFKKKDLLLQAFVHRSYLNENLDFHLSNNERLEFLGDAVLELVVTDYLYLKYPEISEGMLTNWRAALVNTDTGADLPAFTVTATSGGTDSSSNSDSVDPSVTESNDPLTLVMNAPEAFTEGSAADGDLVTTVDTVSDPDGGDHSKV